MHGAGMASLLLHRIILGARGNWRAFLHGATPPDPPVRVLVFCRSCEAETPHDGFDDNGFGWYAQMSRCRRCGRESVEVWPVGLW